MLKSTLTIIGRPKKKIGEFTFFEEDLQNPFFLTMLLIASDPTEKQREILEASGVTISDANGKKVEYSYVEEKKEE